MMLGNIFKFMEVMANCKTFDEARVEILKECIRQLEEAHADMLLRTMDPAELGGDLLNADATLKAVIAQRDYYQNLLATLQGGPSGSE